MRKSILVGMALSLAWIIAFCVLLYLKRDTLNELPINAWGDFFAGVVSPLAFFWLVLGYLQQGEELRNNSDALALQAEELRRSVEEQRALVQVTRENLQLAQDRLKEEREHNAKIFRTRLLVKPWGHEIHGDHVKATVAIVNSGPPISEIRLTSSELKMQVTQSPNMIFDRGHSLLVEVEYVPDHDFNLEISFVDAEERQQCAPIHLFGRKDGCTGNLGKVEDVLVA